MTWSVAVGVVRMKSYNCTADLEREGGERGGGGGEKEREREREREGERLNKNIIISLKPILT